MTDRMTWGGSGDERRDVHVRIPPSVYGMLVDRAVKRGHTVQTEVMLAIYRYLMGGSQLPADAFEKKW